MVDLRRYRILIDPAPPDAPTPLDGGRRVRLDVSATTPPDVLADILAALFQTDSAVDQVTVSLDGVDVGVSSRARIDMLAGGTRAAGDGDHATLPGRSTAYRVLAFRCTVCGNDTRRVHLDDRGGPDCPNGHGRMARDQ